MYKNGLILVLVGIIIVMAVVGIATFNSDKINFDNGKYYEDMSISTGVEGIDSIEIISKNSSMKIIPTDDKEVNVKYEKTENLEYEFEKVGNKLIIKNIKQDYSNFKLFSFNFNIPKGTEIRIPRNILKDLAITNRNAAINIKDFELENIKFNTTNAVINIENIKCSNEIRCNTTNAAINYKNVTVGEMLYNETTNGAINIEQANSKNIELRTTNASIGLESVTAPESLKCRSTNGSIKVEKIESKKIDIDTTNASVTLGLEGKKQEYNRRLSTSNSSIRINNEKYGKESTENYDGAEKSIDIRTTNGKIEIEFGI